MLTDILAQQIPLGGYISIWKVLVFLVLFLLWAWVGQWVDKDAPKVKTNRNFWNNIYMGGGVLVLFLWFVLPAPFFVVLLMFLVIWATLLVIYILHRNARVPKTETILTIDHIKWLLTPAEKDKSGSLRLEFISVNDNELPVPHKEDKERNGYAIAEELLHDMWSRRVSHGEILPGKEQYNVKYIIDGIASIVDQIELEDAVEAIKYLKAVAGLDVLDKRRPQTGSFFTIKTGENTTGWKILTAGSTRGEHLSLERMEESTLVMFDDLGFHPDQHKKINEIIKKTTGITLISGIKESGITTTLYSLVRQHDAFTQNIHSLEKEYLFELDNITQHQVDIGPDAPPFARQLQSVLHSDPDMLMVGFFDDPNMAKISTNAFDQDKKLFIAMSATSAFDALGQWVKAVGRNEKVAASLDCITNQRLIRRLCPDCREAYTPDPNMLKKLNLPLGKIKQFYRPPSEILYDKRGNPILCTTCQGTGYLGRTAVYETLFISETLRSLIEAKEPLENLRTQSRKEKALYLQEQALRKVIDGTTSIQEVLRITAPKKKKRPIGKSGK